jgi:hypothetical protein
MPARDPFAVARNAHLTIFAALSPHARIRVQALDRNELGRSYR